MSPLPETLPMTTLACPPNQAFLTKFSVTNGEMKRRDSSDSQKLERGLEREESMRTLVRTNSIEQVSKPTYLRAASTAALTRGRMVSKVESKLVPTVMQAEINGIWVSNF